MSPLSDFIIHIYHRKTIDRKTLLLYVIINLATAAAGVFCIYSGQFTYLTLCIICAAMYTLPTTIPYIFHMYVPPFLRCLLYIFVFSSQILGSIAGLYVHITCWDAAMHVLGGFICASYGLSLIYFTNKRKAIDWKPIYMVLFSVGFTLLICIGWEVFEFAIGQTNIEKTLFDTASDINNVIKNPYLSTDAIDNINDCLFSLIGASIFGVLSFIEMRRSKKFNVDSQIIITPVEDGDLDAHLKKRVDSEINKKNNFT